MAHTWSMLRGMMPASLVRALPSSELMTSMTHMSATIAASRARPSSDWRAASPRRL